VAKKTKKKEASPPKPEGQAKDGENTPKEPAALPPESKPRSTRAKLKGIIKQNLDAMPGKIPEAPLNQLTTNAEFAFKQIERIDSVRAIVDSEPLYFSRCSDDELKVYEYVTSVLLGETPSHPVPEIRFGSAESDPGSPGSLSDAVEPALPLASLRNNRTEYRDFSERHLAFPASQTR
jgi:hypothetical protein